MELLTVIKMSDHQRGGQENESCVQIDMNLHIFLKINSEYEGKVKRKKE